MDAKILDQVSANTVGNCNMMIADVSMAEYTEYTISNIPFVPKAIICARQRSGSEESTTIIKPMTANQIMKVTAWNIDSIVIKTDFAGHWYFIILG